MRTIKEDGFFLVEVIVAFSLFALICSVLLTTWLVIDEKRKAQQHTQYVLDVAQDELVCFFAHCPEQKREREEQFPGGMIKIAWMIEDGTDWQRGRLEITWPHPAGRDETSSFTVYRLKEDTPW